MTGEHLPLDGLTALITGGGCGIGLATARLFLDNGANVVIAGRDTDVLSQAAKQLQGGERLRCLGGDVSSEGYAKTLVLNTVQAYGSLNILVNNAGVFRGMPLLQMEEEDFDYIVSSNLKATWFMCRFAARPMIEARGGSIVNVSSYLAIRALSSTPCSAYAAAKGGVLSLSRSLAVELAQYKIRVNCVLPGASSNPLLKAGTAYEQVPSAALEDQLEEGEKPGEHEAAARAIMFLADPANDWLTGAELRIDGGLSFI
jgi:NAD(P)-dependent dehydrogenase (short-subunit alcohol dehydrogenase family)